MSAHFKCADEIKKHFPFLIQCKLARWDANFTILVVYAVLLRYSFALPEAMWTFLAQTHLSVPNPSYILSLPASFTCT